MYYYIGGFPTGQPGRAIQWLDLFALMLLRLHKHMGKAGKKIIGAMYFAKEEEAYTDPYMTATFNRMCGTVFFPHIAVRQSAARARKSPILD